MAHDLGAIFLAVECRRLALNPGLIPLFPEVQRLARSYCDDDTSIPAALLILERSRDQPHDDNHDPREAGWMVGPRPEWSVEQRCRMLGRTAIAILSTIGHEVAFLKATERPQN
jgi:hypothetical protein